MAKYTFEELSTTVVKLDKSPAKIPNEAGTEGISFNVREGFRRALNGAYMEEQPSQGNPGVSFETKIKRYEISKKIWFSEQEGVELSIDEQAELQKCIGKMYNGEAFGFLNDIMEKKKK